DRLQPPPRPYSVSRASRTWLQDHSIKVLELPAQSPDMSPNENMWWIIKRSVSKHKPNNLEELKCERLGYPLVDIHL
uniref:Tc1-like transposase DDE domain-containing protein n=1 Tax=Amphiprion ocellaris TaxID=80972 RepID=A0A3Q1CAW8_AMPOC